MFVQLKRGTWSKQVCCCRSHGRKKNCSLFSYKFLYCLYWVWIQSSCQRLFMKLIRYSEHAVYWFSVWCLHFSGNKIQTFVEKEGKNPHFWCWVLLTSHLYGSSSLLVRTCTQRNIVKEDFWLSLGLCGCPLNSSIGCLKMCGKVTEHDLCVHYRRNV